MSNVTEMTDSPSPADALDPVAKSVLNEVAKTARERAADRAGQLNAELHAIVCEYLKPYGPEGVNFEVPNLGGGGRWRWQRVLEAFCHALFKPAAEQDVEKAIRVISDKILEWQKDFQNQKSS